MLLPSFEQKQAGTRSTQCETGVWERTDGAANTKWFPSDAPE
jgi:hypothetical protein